MVQSERDFHSINRGVGKKLKRHLGTYTRNTENGAIRKRLPLNKPRGWKKTKNTLSTYTRNTRNGAIRKRLPLHKPRGGKKLKRQALIQGKHTASRVSSYFPIGGHSATQTELKYENIHKAQTAQKFDTKHKTLRTTAEVSPWNDQ